MYAVPNAAPSDKTSDEKMLPAGWLGSFFAPSVSCAAREMASLRAKKDRLHLSEESGEDAENPVGTLAKKPSWVYNGSILGFSPGKP